MIQFAAMLAAVARAVPILAGLCDRLASLILTARAESRKRRKDAETDSAIEKAVQKAREDAP